MSIEFEMKCHRCRARIFHRLYTTLSQLLRLCDQLAEEVNSQDHDGEHPLCTKCAGVKTAQLWQAVDDNSLTVVATMLHGDLATTGKKGSL